MIQLQLLLLPMVIFHNLYNENHKNSFYYVKKINLLYNNMTTILYNKFKNSLFKDVNSLGYAIKSLSGDIICIDGIIKTDNLESATSIGNITIKNKLKLNIGSSGCAIDLGAGDSTRTNDFYGTIRYREFGGLVLTGDEASKRIDMFADNVYIHANLNVDSVFYLNSIFYCNSLSSQPGNSILLNSNDTYHVLINYFKPSSGNVIFNRSCPYSNVNIEMGNLNVQSGNLSVVGNTNLTNNLIVSSGTTNLRNTTISGNLIITGSLSYNSLSNNNTFNSLSVTGYSTFTNTITCNYGIINYN